MSKLSRYILLLVIPICFFGCPTDPFGPTEGRPGIPIPDSIEDEVPTISEVLVVEEAPALSFEPSVTAAFSVTGTNLGVPSGSRVILIADGVNVADPMIGAAHTQPLSADQVPRFQFVRYWVRLGDIESFAGGSDTTRMTTTSRGTSEADTQKFTETLTIEAESEAGGLFASASVKASASFKATQSFSQTTSTTSAVTHSFSVHPIAGTNLILSVWQLVEEYRYYGANDALFDVQGYEFDEGCLRFIFPTDEIVPISAYYEM